MGNATGSLAKERVESSSCRLSCVDFDERSVVDQPIKGFFVDADGKKGLSGKVVTRAGATPLRARSSPARSAGIADTVENTVGDVSTSALGSVRTLDAGDAAKAGIAGGLSRSSDKLTDFYLDLARQAGPIVEVGAAKDVVVVIQEGVTLEIKPTRPEASSDAPTASSSREHQQCPCMSDSRRRSRIACSPLLPDHSPA
ncbi:MAG: TraB/VirB10 family protein [Sphingobium sp.]|nr:TraB/VirB10 family protein [Sphingobium sp.]